MIEGRGAGGRRKFDRIEDSVGAIMSTRAMWSLTDNHSFGNVDTCEGVGP